MTLDALFQRGPDMGSGVSVGNGTIVTQRVVRGAHGQHCDRQMLRRALREGEEAESGEPVPWFTFIDMLPSHFVFEFPDETKFTVIPEVIFEGDNVTLECESEIVSSNTSWYYEGRRLDMKDGGRFSIHTSVLNNMSLVSRLIIYNFTKHDAGGFPT